MKCHEVFVGVKQVTSIDEIFRGCVHCNYHIKLFIQRQQTIRRTKITTNRYLNI